MNRKMWVAVISVIFLSAMVTYPAMAQIKGPVKIGVVGPHVGPIAWLGEFFSPL